MEHNVVFSYTNEVGVNVINSSNLASVFNSKHSNVRRTIRRLKEKDSTFEYREAVVNGENVYELDKENMAKLQATFKSYPKLNLDIVYDRVPLTEEEEAVLREEINAQKKELEEFMDTKKIRRRVELEVYSTYKEALYMMSEFMKGQIELMKRVNDIEDRTENICNALAGLGETVVDVKGKVEQFVPKTEREYAIRLVEQLSHELNEPIGTTYSRVYTELIGRGFMFPDNHSGEPKINQVERLGGLPKMISIVKNWLRK